MLVDFSVRNFLSFKEETTLSLLAARSVKEHEQDDSIDGNHACCNVIRVQDQDLKLLKLAAIYGANGSGKSNLIKAMSFFKEMVLNSFTDDTILQRVKNLNLSFQYSVESRVEPNSFEMTFIVGDKRYRYGFEIFDEAIESEWLFVKAPDSTREGYCFKRDKKKIKVNPKTYKGAGGVSSRTRENALFLTTCALYNVEVSMDIKEWFRSKFTVISRLDETALNYTATQCAHNEGLLKHITEFLKVLDLGINDLSISEKEVKRHLETKNQYLECSRLTMFPTGIHSEKPIQNGLRDGKAYEIMLERSRYENGCVKETISSPIGIESEGTRKIVALLGPWFETIHNGGVLLIDDFGASFHTLLSCELIKVFQSTTNKSAQLIITTHDTNLLQEELLRRDQIWFTEKNPFGETDLYSLVEFKINQDSSERNEASFSNNYLLGRYGAIPDFDNISFPKSLSD